MSVFEELGELLEYCGNNILDGINDTEWVKTVAMHALDELNRAYDTQEEGPDNGRT